MKKWSAVAPKPSRCRIAQNRRTRKSSKEIREAVSDRGRGVRSRGERPPTRGAPKEKGNRDHETDDHHAGLRRWSGARKRRAGLEPQRRIEAGRMGQAAVRQRGHYIRRQG